MDVTETRKKERRRKVLFPAFSVRSLCVISVDNSSYITLSSTHGSEGTESRNSEKRPKPCFHQWRESAACARKKQFCQSELLNIAVAPCYYRSRGGALLSLTLHSHCFTTAADDSLDGPGAPVFFFPARHGNAYVRRRSLPVFFQARQFRKDLLGAGFMCHRAVGRGCGTHTHTYTTHIRLLFSEGEKR